jgi:hypothetical protein
VSHAGRPPTGAPEAERRPDRHGSEGKRLFDRAGALLPIAASGLLLSDLTGVEALAVTGLLGVVLGPYFAALAAGFRQWPQQVVAADPLRDVRPSRAARGVAWMYATPSRVRALAGVLAVTTIGWAVMAADAVAG